jgi:hypothetical protein
MWCFLPIFHMLMPHIKRKKCKKKLYTLPHRTRLMLQKRLHDGARKKREIREKKKEEGRISLAVGLRDPPLGLAGRISAGSLPICLFGFFFFFFPSGDLESPLGLLPEGSRRRSKPRQLAATHLAASRGPATETHGWVSPAVGFFFFPSGGFDFFVFRMIKFQIGLTFPSRF